MQPRHKLTYLGPILFCIVFQQTASLLDHSSRILPSDSYQILGQAGFRRLGQCNYTYAWLIPPPASNLDAYGHALACTRLQLQDGRIVRNPVITDPQLPEEFSRADEELKHVNKGLTATLVDLNRLDVLMRAERLIDGGYRVLPSGPLADAIRYFYLADRVGSWNILAILRPDQIKLELIDPISADHVLIPQHVLCSRKQCPPVPVTTEDSLVEADIANRYSNQSRTLSAALAKSDRHNRELYMQLVISRVACALLSFLCIVFAITALALCIRLRRYPGYCRKPAPPSEISVYREQNHSPSYFQANGKLNIGQPSPVYLTEASPRHIGGMGQMINDTGSANNVVMTTSNLSECGAIGGMGGAPISYTALTPQYGHLPAYAIPGSRASIYNDASGMVTLVPVNSRGIFLSHQNGSSSPVPSNHSYTDGKSGIVRSGSLGRYSGSNLSYSEAARRKLIRTNRNNYRSDLQSQNGINNGGITDQVQSQTPGPPAQQQIIPAPPPLATPIPGANHQHLSQAQSTQNTSVGQLSCEQHGNDLLLKASSIPMPSDLISFQANSQLASVIHRFPGDLHAYKMSTSGMSGSAKEECGSPKPGQVNHMNESCVALIRKPALAN
ncbi:hypothetical protein FBUS_10322 [Fasciolopsis buskii]|uniref:Uncharacterized protein n=1 Tax=Fasciolopsis buskii TaxID=27845 RepID=A0A8E0VHW4_9TREM|nr:hypothetical protein FBUS_10322 [Fasciolopsis buski]